MSELIKYKLTFPQQQIRVYDNTLTFSIGNMRSRTPCVVYFKFYAFDLYKNIIAEYTSPRWVVLPEYNRYVETFDLTFINDKDSGDMDSYQIELYTVGVTSENPLYFNRIQLNSGEDKPYHQPNDAIIDVPIGFLNNSYINLYDESDTFLQIIRPYHEELTTSTLKPAQVTVLAPHLPFETEFDNPVKIFYEYMYQIEQRIGVEK